MKKREFDNMSDMIYAYGMSDEDKPLVWLEGEIKTPPFTKEARIEAGILLRRLQQAKTLECRMQGCCLQSVRDVTNCASETRTGIGESFTELIPTRL